jgi:hypothetical protein
VASVEIVREFEKVFGKDNKQEGRKVEAKTYIETINNTGTMNFN